jgi:DNA-binding GntR family transcriptional regulator
VYKTMVELYPKWMATGSETTGRRRARDARTAARAPKPSVEGIHERVLNAILEHRLRPGVQLVEERLAAVFGVSRTKIRHALARLAHDGIVTVFPNRGAFVSRPTREEVHDVFEARRLIEPALVRRLAGRTTPALVRRLRDHVKHENAARKSGDHRAVLRLTGEFHLLLAEMAGNRVLARTMREVEPLTALAIVHYEAPEALACPEHEHAALADAIESGGAERAAKLMLEHLDHVEAALDLTPPVETGGDLEAAFS